MNKLTKRTLSMILSGALMISMAACSDSSDDDGDETEVPTSVTIPADTSETQQTEAAETEIGMNYGYEILAQLESETGADSFMVNMTDPCIFTDSETGLDLELTFYGTIMYYRPEGGVENTDELKAEIAQIVVNAFAEAIDEQDDQITYAQIDDVRSDIEDHVGSKVLEAVELDNAYLQIGGISLTADSQTAYEDARL